MLDQVLQVTILVSDLKKAANFYSYVLGLPVITQSDRTAEFRTEGVILAVRPRDAGGQTQTKQPAAGSGSTQITFQVADLDVAFNEAKGRGAKVLAAPRTVDAGRMARVADPEGNIVELFEPEA
jgi:predicted enzyme related to lactoylglutathione lyase